MGTALEKARCGTGGPGRPAGARPLQSARAPVVPTRGVLRHLWDWRAVVSAPRQGREATWPAPHRARSGIIQRGAADAGIEERVSGHSLRVGGAQSLAAAGPAGRRDADRRPMAIPSMPSRYAGGQLAARGAVARLRYGV